MRKVLWTGSFPGIIKAVTDLPVTGFERRLLFCCLEEYYENKSYNTDADRHELCLYASGMRAIFGCSDKPRAERCHEVYNGKESKLKWYSGFR